MEAFELKIDLTTFILTIVLFVSFITIILMYYGPKNNKNLNESGESEEMGQLKLAAWEMVNEMKKQSEECMEFMEQKVDRVEQSLLLLEKNKKEVEFSLEKIMEECERLQSDVDDKTPYSPEMGDKIISMDEKKRNVYKLFHDGHDIEYIAKQLGLNKGLIEVILNMNGKKKISM
jgi:cbb3-type cytochrome oxidase subunit 3